MGGKEAVAVPNRRKLKIAGMSEARYLELLNFCMQYGEKKDELRSMTFLTNGEGGGRSGRVSRPTEEIALRRARLETDIGMIEASAVEAGGVVVAPFILKNVTEKMHYRVLGNVPCGINQFYRMRRRFFEILDSKKR